MPEQSIKLLACISVVSFADDRQIIFTISSEDSEKCVTSRSSLEKFGLLAINLSTKGQKSTAALCSCPNMQFSWASGSELTIRRD
jgi:hypothetical protein